MKKNLPVSRWVVAGFLAVAGIYVTASIMSGSGPGGGYSNAPSEGNCTSCHGGTLNPTPGNLVNLTMTGIPTSGYIPDSTYSITISYSQNGINKFGFQITSLTQNGNNPIGLFTAGTGNTKVTTSVSGKTREYIQHNSSGTSGTGSRSWTFSWRAPATIQDTIIFYTVVNAANSDGGTSGDQIYAKTFKIAPSTLLPEAIITTSKASVCAGDTVSFYGSGTNNPVSYRWKFHSGSPQIVTTQNVVRTYNSPGTFNDTLWVTNNKGQSRPVRYQMQVLSRPATPTITLVTNDTACVGDTLTLSVNSQLGMKYLWNTGNPADTFTTVKITGDGQYSVTAINANGCQNISSPVNLIFLPRPLVTLTSNAQSDTLCEQDTLKVNATPGYSRYDFFDNNVLVQSSASPDFRVSSPGNHAVRVEVFNGYCTEDGQNALNHVIKSRLSAPQVQCGQATTGSVNFVWQPVAGAGSYEVRINGGSWVPANGTHSHQVSGLTFSTQVQADIRAVGSGLCSEGKVSSLSCTSLPCSNIGFEIKRSDTLICAGDSVQVSVENISTPNFEISYNGSPYSTDTIFWFKPSNSNDQLLIDIKDLNSPSCPPIQTSAGVIVDDPSVPQLNIGSLDPEICLGTEILLQVLGSYSTYHFYKNGTALQSSSQNGFTYSGLIDQDRIQVGVVNLVCEIKSREYTVTVNTPQDAGFTVSGTNRSYTFTDTTSNISSRNWNLGDNSPEKQDQSFNYDYAANGTYLVKLRTMDVNGCEDSASQQVLADNIGIDDRQNMLFRYSPNPASGIVTVDIFGIHHQAIIRILDINGREMLSREVNQSVNQLNVSELAQGTYVIEVSSNGELVRSRLVIAK